MRPFVLILLLLAAVPLRGEFRIAPTEKTEPARAGTVWEPRMATNGSGFLVAWIDHRPPEDASSWALEGHVRAMRLDANGQRIDERDFEIAPLTRGNIAVASDGRDYLLAYPTDVAGKPKVRFARIASDAGARARPLTEEIDGSLLDLAYANGLYAIATSEGVYFLDASGTIMRAASRVRASRLLAARDGRLLLVWSSRDEIRIALVHVGDALDPNFRGPVDPLSLGRESLYGFEVAEGAHGFAVLILTNEGELLTRILDAEARVASMPVNVGQLDYQSYDSAVIARLGAGYIVVVKEWPDGGVTQRAITTMRLDAMGRPLHADPESLPLPTAFDIVSAPGAGGTAMLAYSGGEAIRVQRLSLGGTPMLEGEGVIASMSRASQRDAMVARCASFDAVVWREREDVVDRLLLRRFSHDGRPLGQAVRLDTTWGGAPVITCGRTTALVSWVARDSQTDHAKGALIDAISPPRIFELARDNPSLSIVFDGTDYVGAVVGFTSRLIRWNEQGELLRTETFPLVSYEGGPVRSYSTKGALGWNGQELLFVFNELLVNATYQRTRTLLRAYRFDRELARIGAPVEIAGYTNENFLDLAVAASPDAWLLGWAFETSPWEVRHPYSARILSDGTVLDPNGVRSGATSSARLYQVSWNGSRWELLTTNRLITRTRDGAIAEFPLAASDVRIQALTPSGDRRLFLYVRVEPMDGVYELYGDHVDASSWTPASRRRSARQ